MVCNEYGKWDIGENKTRGCGKCEINISDLDNLKDIPLGFVVSILIVILIQDQSPTCIVSPKNSSVLCDGTMEAAIGKPQSPRSVLEHNKTMCKGVLNNWRLSRNPNNYFSSDKYSRIVINSMRDIDAMQDLDSLGKLCFGILRAVKVADTL